MSEDSELAALIARVEGLRAEVQALKDQTGERFNKSRIALLEAENELLQLKLARAENDPKIEVASSSQATVELIRHVHTRLNETVTPDTLLVSVRDCIRSEGADWLKRERRILYVLSSFLAVIGLSVPLITKVLTSQVASEARSAALAAAKNQLDEEVEAARTRREQINEAMSELKGSTEERIKGARDEISNELKAQRTALGLLETETEAERRRLSRVVQTASHSLTTKVNSATLEIDDRVGILSRTLEEKVERASQVELTLKRLEETVGKSIPDDQVQIMAKRLKLLDDYLRSDASAASSVAALTSAALEARPVGTVAAWPSRQPPPRGWLLCDGRTTIGRANPDQGLQPVEPRFKRLLEILLDNPGCRTPDGNVTVPNYAGFFLRGFDPRAQVDPERGGGHFGLSQGWSTGRPSALQVASAGAHAHTTPTSNVGGSEKVARGGSAHYTNASTSTAGAHTHSISGWDQESRPVNVAVNWIIYVGESR